MFVFLDYLSLYLHAIVLYGDPVVFLFFCFAHHIFCLFVMKESVKFFCF